MHNRWFSWVRKLYGPDEEPQHATLASADWADPTLIGRSLPIRRDAVGAKSPAESAKGPSNDWDEV